MIERDTICAIASAQGMGAIGVLRLSGSQALAIVRRALRADEQQELTARHLYVRELIDPNHGTVIDQVTVCFLPGPRSYTGEDMVEVFGHGGGLNLRNIERLFLTLGARPAQAGEFTRRAFENGKIDLAQAEAVAQVIAARSDEALRNAQKVLQGALSRRVGEVRQAMVDIAANLEACLDFAEDVETSVSQVELLKEHSRVASELEALLGTFRRGRLLTNGITVALVGRVNAGKSSLFNALLGTTRALVSSEAGTTRDYLEAQTSWQGIPLLLVDTAGKRAAEDMSPLERAGHRLAEDRISSCDVTVEVVDLSVWDGGAVGVRQGERQLVAANKVDVLTQEDIAIRSKALEEALGVPVIAISATRSLGLENLADEVVRAALGSSSIDFDEQRETIQVTEARHADALRRALDALHEGESALRQEIAPELVVEHTREALRALGEITGETYTESVLDAVFAHFCIGK